MKLIQTIKIALIGAVIALTGCSRSSIEAGYVGVKVDLYGSDKGVQAEVVGPGKYWLSYNEEMYKFPTFTQNVTWRRSEKEDESITFQDREGIQINADVGVSLSVPFDQAAKVFQKYRKGIDEVSDIYVRNMVRDAINSETSKMDVENIYGPGKEQLMTAVTTRVRDQVAPLGINVEKIYWIGAMRLPNSITNAINAKIEATQKAQQRENELQTAKAQAEIAREEARGEADAAIIAAKGRAESNKMIQASITKELIEYTKAQRWDGKLPQVTGSSVPMINMN